MLINKLTSSGPVSPSNATITGAFMLHKSQPKPELNPEINSAISNITWSRICKTKITLLAGPEYPKFLHFHTSPYILMCFELVLPVPAHASHQYHLKEGQEFPPSCYHYPLPLLPFPVNYPHKSISIQLYTHKQSIKSIQAGTERQV